MVRMKQNANTLVTQLQYFRMHMLQICFDRTTMVFAQRHTWRDQVPFLTLRSPEHYTTQTEKSELGRTLDRITL